MIVNSPCVQFSRIVEKPNRFNPHKTEWLKKGSSKIDRNASVFVENVKIIFNLITIEKKIDNGYDLNVKNRLTLHDNGEFRIS